MLPFVQQTILERSLLLFPVVSRMHRLLCKVGGGCQLEWWSASADTKLPVNEIYTIFIIFKKNLSVCSLHTSCWCSHRPLKLTRAFKRWFILSGREMNESTSCYNTDLSVDISKKYICSNYGQKPRLDSQVCLCGCWGKGLNVCSLTTDRNVMEKIIHFWWRKKIKENPGWNCKSPWSALPKKL